MTEPLYKIDCPLLKLVNTSNVRHHWSERKRIQDRVRRHVVVGMLEAGYTNVTPLAKARVGITVWHPGLYDHDGLHCAIKPVLDAIVARKMSYGGRRPGLIEDDSPKVCELAAIQMRGAWRVLIEVWPV